jgi:hypothetical protein
MTPRLRASHRFREDLVPAAQLLGESIVVVGGPHCHSAQGVGRSAGLGLGGITEEESVPNRNDSNPSYPIISIDVDDFTLDSPTILGTESQANPNKP